MFTYESRLDKSIPTIHCYEPSYLIDRIEYEESHVYLSLLRSGLVGHLDLVRWELKDFDKGHRNTFIQTYRELLPHGTNSHDGAHPDYRWKFGIYQRQTLISSDTMGLCINWKRNFRRQPRKRCSGEIVAHWNQKENYTAYHTHLRKVEEIMVAMGLEWEVSYAELTQDTVSPDVGNYMFKHALLKSGNADQLMWWDDVSKKMKAGTNRRANNHYQNNNKSVKQLCCHIKSRSEDYFDEDLQSFIRRAELRIKKAVIERYGSCAVDTVIENQQRIWDEHVVWRQVHRKQLRKLRMNFKRRKELEEGFVIHAVNHLLQKGISNSEARQRWVLPIAKLNCKYL
jgi:hypothetical protein